MKEYDNNEYGRDFHVIEYGKDDMFGGYPTDNMMNILMKARLEYKYLKVIDKTYGVEHINYYKDGAKHHDFGPSETYDSVHKKYYVNDKKMKDDEFTNWRRTKLMDEMLNDISHTNI